MPDGISASTVQLGQEIDPVEYCHEQGWTDGLPVVPPTPERVRAMVSAAGRDGQEVLGVLPPIGSEVTVEKVAINAVLAGCLPEYFPVVLTAIECLTRRERSVAGMLTTIHGDAPLMIVNGPARNTLNFNAGANTFGPGWRANTTVGRAVALTMRNVAIGPPGQFDQATQTNPGKLTFCIAEFEEVSPWLPLHVERGYDAQDSTVTVMAAQGPHHITDLVSTTGKGVLNTLADGMAIMGTYNIYWGGEVLVVLSPTHARIIGGDGWSKDEVKYHLWEKARKPMGQLKQGGCYNFSGLISWPKWVDVDDDDFLVPVAFRPEDILVMVAGGEVGSYSSIIFSTGLRSITGRVPV